MIVVGGVYTEICLSPSVRAIFGSGGRAAVALASSGENVELHTFCPINVQNRVEASLGGAVSKFVFHGADAHPVFEYLHPLARPLVYPWPVNATGEFSVQGDSVLRFGMMEGEAKVTARCAVYDPQSPTPARFRANGSSADTLAIILNERELRSAYSGEDEAHAANALSREEAATVLVVKAGAVGARIYVDGDIVGNVPPYQSERVYKIGSGDIFSAAFAHAWANRGMVPLQAADFASRSVARYCETRDPAFAPEGGDDRVAVSFTSGRRVYLAAPFFTTSELWAVQEAVRCLEEIGAGVFSPFHEIGLGAANEVAMADLDALKNSAAVLAIVSSGDPGTLFEVGYARKLGKPVIALSENARDSDATMLAGTECVITRDLSTAAYRAAWASWA